MGDKIDRSKPRERFDRPGHNNPSAHRTAADTRLYVTNHTLNRFRDRIAPHLAGTSPRDLRNLILKQIEQGREATAEQLNLIRQSRARQAESLSGGRKFGQDKIVINDFVAYVIEQNPNYGPLVVACYECEYLRILERGPVAAAAEVAPLVDAGEWEWEWPDETPENSSDPYCDLLAAFRNGDNIKVAGSWYVELSGVPGRILERTIRTKGKWRVITHIQREQFAIIPAATDAARESNRKERKRVEIERRKQWERCGHDWQGKAGDE